VGNSFDSNMLHELPVELRDSPAEVVAVSTGSGTRRPRRPEPSRDGADLRRALGNQNNITLDVWT